jgi:hypothetical protein
MNGETVPDDELAAQMALKVTEELDDLWPSKPGSRK